MDIEYDLHTAMITDPAYMLEATRQELDLVRQELESLRRENGILRANAKAQGILDDIGAAGKSRASQVRNLVRIISNQRAEIKRLTAREVRHD